MPNPQGTRFVERDREVLAGLAMARYLDTEQLARLVFRGRSESVARGRLRRLAGRGAYGLDPLVRFVPFRQASGAPRRAWTLTEGGYVLAKQLVPYARVPGSDVGAAFLEHALVLNDVLIDLIVGTSSESVSLADLPFRWLAETGECIEFDWYDRATLAVQRSRIRPDATLEIGEPRRRVFLECETGSRTLVSLDPTNTGATLAKIQRYAQLIAGTTGQHEGMTPYLTVFPDGFTPAVVFLAHSERRRDAIRKLLSDPQRAVRIHVRAYTFQEAASALGALASGRPAVPADTHVAGVTRAELELLHRALSFVAPGNERRSADEDSARRAALALVTRLHTTANKALVRVSGRS